jgi:hypothetical protein
MPVSWAEVVARRLERSALVSRSDDLVELTGRICGVHAQVQASAELQLAARVGAIVQADVRGALWDRRELVKAWTLRGTLHLHPAAELAHWHAARRAVAHRGAGMPEWRDPAGIVHPARSGGRVVATVRDVLDGRCLLREQLVEEVVARVGPSPRERLRSGFTFFLGDLCQGPPQGAKVTFARPDQWISYWQDVDGTDALRTACRRFLRTYGPARPGDSSVVGCRT